MGILESIFLAEEYSLGMYACLYCIADSHGSKESPGNPSEQVIHLDTSVDAKFAWKL